MESKEFYKSKTFWGLAAMVAGAILKSLGITSDADAPAIEQWATQYGPILVEAIGAAVTLWGRWTADKPLALKAQPAPKEPEPTENEV